MATRLTSLAQTAVKAVKGQLDETRRRRTDAREARRKPPFSRKGAEREVAIQRENSRRQPGGL